MEHNVYRGVKSVQEAHQLSERFRDWFDEVEIYIYDEWEDKDGEIIFCGSSGIKIEETCNASIKCRVDNVLENVYPNKYSTVLFKGTLRKYD